MATKKQAAATKGVVVNKNKNSKLQPTATKNAKNSQISRTRKLTRRTKKKLTKTETKSKKLPNAWVILGRSLRHLWSHKKLFAGILLIYALLSIIFVKGFAGNFQLGSIKQNLQDSFGSTMNTWNTSFTLFGLLIGSSGTTSGEAGSVYQLFLLILASLALIWALRRTYEKPVKIRIRDSFYKGMYPLIPLLLVLIVIIIQLIPMLIGVSIYSIVQNANAAVSGWERALWTAFLLATVSVSVYMISSSIFAVYIVTLQDMTPMRALKGARKLVKFRRWEIIRKVLFLPAVTLLAAAVVLIPLIIIMPTLAEVIYFIFSMAFLGVVHSYGYALYRELL